MTLYITNGYIPIFSTNTKKYLIVKKAKTIDVTNPTNIGSKSIDPSNDIISFNKKTRAPKIVGIARRKANLEASFKLRPIRSAAVIAVPDLDAPGNNAKT